MARGMNYIDRQPNFFVQRKKLYTLGNLIIYFLSVSLTWQDIRSSTKAKNALIKNHAKETGGPASSQVLTETDQNLALMGSTVVEGHKTVQESNVQIVTNLCCIVL